MNKNNEVLSLTSKDIIISIIEAAFAIGFPEYSCFIAGVAELSKSLLGNKIEKILKDKDLSEFSKDIKDIIYRCSVIKDLNSAQKQKAVDNALDIINTIDDDNLENKITSFDVLYNYVFELVKNQKENTTLDYQKQISNIVVYYILFFYKKILNEDDYSKFEIVSFIEINNKLEDIYSIINNYLATIKNNTSSISSVLNKCSDRFTETLYLHKSPEFYKNNIDERVSLKNLFVEPNIIDIFDNYKNEINIYDFLITEVFQDDRLTKSQKPLILLGDAGSGKTSIIYWLAYIYLSSEEEKKEKIFHNKDLIIVRLRDLDRECISKDGIYKAICDYLGILSQKESFDDKYVILDGLDEIKINENYIDYDEEIKLLRKNFDSAYRLIITSRPSVLVEKIDGFLFDSYVIKPFNHFQKIQWVDKFKNVAYISEDIKKYILAENNSVIETEQGKINVDNSILDYPQLMYMISSKKPNEGNWSLNNKWSIYHHIFSDEVIDRNYEIYEYSKQPFIDKKKAIYDMLQLIGYEMYLNNSSTKISTSKISELVKKLNQKHINSIKYIEDAFKDYGYKYGCYWNIINDNTEIEFYHNNIRDFFIAEYIFNQLNKIFELIQNISLVNLTDKQKYDIVAKLFNLFRGIPIQKEVVDFLVSKTTFKKDDYKDEPLLFFIYNNVCIKNDDLSEYINEKQSQIQNFMKLAFTNFSIFDEDIENNDIHSIDVISNFLNDFISIIHAIVSQNNDYTCLSLYDGEKNNFLPNVYINTKYFRYIDLSKACLNGADLNRSNLRGAFLTKANLRAASLAYSDLSFAILNYVDMREADLRVSDLNSAHLKYAKLMYSRFNRADLSHAQFCEANLTEAIFENSILRYTDFSHANLFCANLRNVYGISIDFNNANLRDTNFMHSVFSNSNFIEANLSDANLSECEFREGTFFDAIVRNADLRNSDFSDVSLKCADFSYSDFRDANFSRTDFTGAKLKYIQFEGANLYNANLIDADFDCSQIIKAINWETAKYNDEKREELKKYIK